MKTVIPEALKADLPKTAWGKTLTATPVVMTVVATLLAGLASSEMTRAQYDRSLAAQHQSKAGDQWSFFQAKRLRGALQRSTLDLLQSASEVHPLDAAVLKQAFAGQLPSPPPTSQTDGTRLQGELQAALNSPATQQALALMRQGELPAVDAGPEPPPELKAAMEAVESSLPDPELNPILAKVTDAALTDALRAARNRAQAFDAATKPVNQAIDQLDGLLLKCRDAFASRPGAPTAGPAPALSVAGLRRDFTAARLRYLALRYETEARLNQAIANLYELEVRKSNVSAERHHARSQRFFYGMLAAQAAVIIATFAIAAKQRNLLWTLAAAAGVAAIALAIYVYLCV